MKQTLTERIEQLWPIQGGDGGKLSVVTLVSLVRDGIAYELDHGASMDEVYDIFQEYELLSPVVDSERLEAVCRFKRFDLNVPKRPPKPKDYDTIAVKAAMTKAKKRAEKRAAERKAFEEQLEQDRRWRGWQAAVKRAEQEPGPKKVDRISQFDYARYVGQDQPARHSNLREANLLLQQAMGPQYVMTPHPFDKRYVESLLDQVDLTWPDAMTCVRFYDSRHRDYPSYLHFINLSFEAGKGRPAGVLIEFGRTTIGGYEGPLEIFKVRETRKEADVFIFEDGEIADKIQTLIRQNSPYTVFKLLQSGNI